MNYKAVYDKLMQKARNRGCVSGYSEKHHVVPRCLGGSNSKDNLVVLTAEEHFLAHQLLVKIHPGNHKLAYAAQAMVFKNDKTRRSNKLYGWLKRRLAQASADKMKCCNPMNTAEGRKNFEEAMKSHSQKVSGANSGKARKIVCVETGQEFETRSAAGEWLRSIGHEKAHGGSLSEALRDPSKYAAFGFHWNYA